MIIRDKRKRPGKKFKRKKKEFIALTCWNYKLSSKLSRSAKPEPGALDDISKPKPKRRSRRYASEV